MDCFSTTEQSIVFYDYTLAYLWVHQFNTTTIKNKLAEFLTLLNSILLEE